MFYSFFKAAPTKKIMKYYKQNEKFEDRQVKRNTKICFFR